MHGSLGSLSCDVRGAGGKRNVNMESQNPAAVLPFSPITLTANTINRFIIRSTMSSRLMDSAAANGKRATNPQRADVLDPRFS
jgi:hypothetical protein